MASQMCITGHRFIVLVDGNSLFVEKKFLHDRCHKPNVCTNHHWRGQNNVQGCFGAVLIVSVPWAMLWHGPVPDSRLALTSLTLVRTALSPRHHHVKVGPPC